MKLAMYLATRDAFPYIFPTLEIVTGGRRNHVKDPSHTIPATKAVKRIRARRHTVEILRSAPIPILGEFCAHALPLVLVRHFKRLMI